MLRVNDIVFRPFRLSGLAAHPFPAWFGHAPVSRCCRLYSSTSPSIGVFESSMNASITSAGSVGPSILETSQTISSRRSTHRETATYLARCSSIGPPGWELAFFPPRLEHTAFDGPELNHVLKKRQAFISRPSTPASADRKSTRLNS